MSTTYVHAKSNNSLFKAATNLRKDQGKSSNSFATAARESQAPPNRSSYLIQSVQEYSNVHRNNSGTRQLQLRDLSANTISRLALDTLLSAKHKRTESQSTRKFVHSIQSPSKQSAHSRQSSQHFRVRPLNPNKAA